MRHVIALSCLRLAAGLVTLATRLAPRPVEREPDVILDTMSDEDWLTLADSEILAAALRGTVG